MSRCQPPRSMVATIDLQSFYPTLSPISGFDKTIDNADQTAPSLG